MCDLTTKWILESAQSLTCALIYWYYVLLEAVTELSRTHSSEWEGTPPLRKERQAQPWALESGELIPQNERELPAQQGAACS